jgi:hypothetical protein
VANADGGEAMLFDKSGAARSAKREDTVLSNRVARGGRQRLPPDGQGHLAWPNPAGPQNESGGATSPATVAVIRF